jgi:hypothetical protein
MTTVALFNLLYRPMAPSTSEMLPSAFLPTTAPLFPITKLIGTPPLCPSPMSLSISAPSQTHLLPPKYP